MHRNEDITKCNTKEQVTQHILHGTGSRKASHAQDQDKQHVMHGTGTR